MQKYKTISSIDAKKIIDTEDVFILDVRTYEEYDESHIYNSILVPVDDIEIKIETIIPNKSKKILIYCRSGKRSKIAAEKMINLGYKNVFDFGGIIDWPFEIVQ